MSQVAHLTEPVTSDTLAPEITHCVVCDTPMRGYRSDARVCGGACRAALSRLKRLPGSPTFWAFYVQIRRCRPAHKRTLSDGGEREA